ncbi:MAG: hypothetical protein ACT4OE_02555, partial [Sphingosinicella sp.]
MNSGLPKLIFAIASTQKTANLAPIVHLARPKSGDRVLWLNSGRAVSGAWTEGVDAVLDARNIGRLEPIAFSDAASEVYDSVSQGLASRHDLQGFSPWLVFNGGSKTMPAQIDQAIRDRFGGRTVCFSDVNSAVLTVWGQDWRAGRREQMGACLRLEEILRCNGYQPTGAAPRSLMPGSDPVALICPGYAEETDATDAVHTRMERSIASFSPIELPKYHHLDDDAKEDWSRALGRVFDPARGYLRRGRPNWTEPNCLTPNEASRTALFN